MEPGSFVDALFQGEWVEGYILSFSLGVLKVQLDSSLESSPVSMRLSQVAEFRSRTKRNSGISDLLTPIYIASGLTSFLQAEVESIMKSKRYLESENQFVQFFAGLLPIYSKMTASIPKRNVADCILIIEEAVLAYFAELKLKITVFHRDSAFWNTWNSLAPVINNLLEQLQSSDRVAKIVHCYIRFLGLSFFNVSLLRSFQFFRHYVKWSYISDDILMRDMLLDAYFEYIDYCLKLCDLKETICSLLDLGELQTLLSPTDRKHEEINAAVQTKMQEITSFPFNFSQFSSEIVRLIVLYNRLFQVSTSSFLLMFTALDEFSIQQLLLTSMSMEEATRFAHHGFQLSFLTANFQGTPWRTVMREAMKSNGNVAYLFDDDMCETIEEILDVLPNLDSKQSYHLWEVAKGQTSALFIDCKNLGYFDLRQFQVKRRNGLNWIISKVQKFRAIPKLLWYEIIGFAL